MSSSSTDDSGDQGQPTMNEEGVSLGEFMMNGSLEPNLRKTMQGLIGLLETLSEWREQQMLMGVILEDLAERIYQMPMGVIIARICMERGIDLADGSPGFN